MTTPLKPSQTDTAPAAAAAPTTPGTDAPATSVQIPVRSAGVDPQMEPTADVDWLVEAAAEADGLVQADGLMQVPAEASGLVQAAAEAGGLAPVPTEADSPVQPTAEADGLVRVPAVIDGRVRLTTEVDGLTQVTVELDGVVAARGQVAVWGTYATFDQIVTEPAYRRRGLGSVVMQTLSNAATQQGARTGVLVATDDGRALYTRLGWELVSTLNVAWIRA
ncbi:GNAT family N-acetyltransferase [Kribbella endophytica]